ncbi:MAG: hypothetical protein IJZ57_06985 [Clostridia bacterium]|nr:hypothetical protein [Clostridia bacterium]
MKKFFKKSLAVLLSLTVIFSLVAVAFPSASALNVYTDIPTVYVEGQGTTLGIPNGDGSYEKIYGIEIPEGYIESAVEENIDVFLLAVVTQDWDDFCDVLYEKFIPLYEEIKLDEKGQPTNGSKETWDWTKETLDATTVNGGYEFDQFRYHYDWRLSPYQLADELHEYIKAVCEVTGHEKVALAGRCLGSCVTMAYLEKYGTEYVSDHILYASALKGVDFCSQAFCGNLYLEGDGVERFFYDIDLGLSSTMTDFLQSFLTVANETYGLDLALWSVNNVIPKIKYNLFPRLLRDTYASFPSYWAMVGEEYYDEAKSVVFDGVDAEVYADFIELIDSYHYNVQVPAEEIIARQYEEGVEYYNITKYGMQAIPVTENTDVLSDSYVDVAGASLGATTGTVSTNLSDDYISVAEINGTDGYISLDKKIDASTCLFPEQTWFIKNLKHTDFPDEVNVLMAEMINNPGFSISSNESYPQFLVYDVETHVISPMAEENKDTTDKWENSFWDALRKLFAAIIQMIKDAITPTTPVV